MNKNRKKYEDYQVSYDALKTELSAGKVNLDRPTKLPVAKIKFAATVLQPRLMAGERAASEDHIRTLMKLIRNKDDHQLDPITVWWSGKNWRCLDGHHRVVAYQRLREATKDPIVVAEISVKVFVGSLDEAIREATSLNSKVSLGMSFEDRRESAWRTVLREPDCSPKEVAALVGIGWRTVHTMKTTAQRLLTDKSLWVDDGFRVGPVNVQSLTWDQALKASKGNPVVPDKDDAWMKIEADKMAKKFSQTFNVSLKTKPTVTAMALKRYARQLPLNLVEEWLTHALISDGDLDRVQRALDERRHGDQVDDGGADSELD